MPVIRDVVQNETGKKVDILIEVDEGEEIPERGSYDYGDRRGPLDQVPEILKKAVELIHTCAEQIGEAVQKIPKPKQPSGLEVQFAVKIDSEMNALIAKASTGAQLQVTLKWEKDDK